MVVIHEDRPLVFTICLMIHSATCGTMAFPSALSRSTRLGIP